MPQFGKAEVIEVNVLCVLCISMYKGIERIENGVGKMECRKHVITKEKFIAKHRTTVRK